MNEIRLTYNFFGKWWNVLAVSLCAIIVYQGFYYLHPASQGWWKTPEFSWLNLLRFIFIDQALIECITVYVIFRGIRYFAGITRLYTVRRRGAQYALYFLKFLPLFLVVYFLFAPLTLTIRFLYHTYYYSETIVSYDDYFFLDLKLYLVYLIPVMLMGYGSLVVNFLSAKAAMQKGQPAHPAGPSSEKKLLLVKDEIGELPIPVTGILWIRKEGKKNIIKTKKCSYFTNATLNALEKELNPFNFIRVNRAILMPVENILNYSFWENEKYILRTKDGEEFVISRDRLKKIKAERFVATNGK